jgi:hypothetical protein
MDALKEMRAIFLITNICKMERQLVELLAEKEKKVRKSAKKVVTSKKKK